MAEQAPTPMEIFCDGAGELESKHVAYREAFQAQALAAKGLKAAQAATRAASQDGNMYGNALLERIHEAAGEGADPGEYLEAILNTFYFSNESVGTQIAEQLRPMRDQLSSGPIPVGIVGAAGRDVRLGLSAGDINVRRRNEDEAGFDTETGIRLEVPLTEIVGFSDGTFSSETAWDYYGNRAASPIGIRQRLSQLRIAASEEEVRELNDTPHAPYSEHDTVMHYERKIKGLSGFVPFVAYGEGAVQSLLSALHEGRGMEYVTKRPDGDDVLAAGISLGIDPEGIADVDAEELKVRLQKTFKQEVTRTVFRSIFLENQRRQFPYSGSSAMNWPITASPQVMAYAAVEPDEVVAALRNGIENAHKMIRVDDPADVPSVLFTHEKEHRLLEEEARTIAMGVIASRYSIDITSSQLESDTLSSLLSERLKENRAALKRSERLERRNRVRK